MGWQVRVLISKFLFSFSSSYDSFRQPRTVSIAIILRMLIMFRSRLWCTQNVTDPQAFRVDLRSRRVFSSVLLKLWYESHHCRPL